MYCISWYLFTYVVFVTCWLLRSNLRLWQFVMVLWFVMESVAICNVSRDWYGKRTFMTYIVWVCIHMLFIRLTYTNVRRIYRIYLHMMTEPFYVLSYRNSLGIQSPGDRPPRGRCLYLWWPYTLPCNYLFAWNWNAGMCDIWVPCASKYIWMD